MGIHKADIAELRARYSAGEYIKAIASALDISHATVCRHAKRAGLFRQGAASESHQVNTRIPDVLVARIGRIAARRRIPQCVVIIELLRDALDRAEAR